VEERYTSPSISWFLLLALLVHAFIFQTEWVKRTLLSHIDTEKWLARSSSPIELEFMDRIKNLPVVETSDAVDDPALKDKPASYVGEFTNRVKEETRALKKGRFHEGKEIAGAQGEEADDVLGEEEGELPKNSGKRGLGISDLLIPGASPNELKGVKDGVQTVLNTDKVIYASFINRVADEIYDPWVRNCESGLREIFHRRGKLESNTFITKVQVTLDPEGKVTGIQLVETSGIPELDDAPKKAFWEAEAFPNPPKQLVDTDGFLRISYEFHFEYRNSSFNIIPERI
jgi:TonB family protein